MSPGEWTFIMMPPGLTIGFILSLLLVATMLPGLEEVKVTRKRDREERQSSMRCRLSAAIPSEICPSLLSRHLDSGRDVLLSSSLEAAPGKKKTPASVDEREEVTGEPVVERAGPIRSCKNQRRSEQEEWEWNGKLGMGRNEEYKGQKKRKRPGSVTRKDRRRRNIYIYWIRRVEEGRKVENFGQRK